MSVIQTTVIYMCMYGMLTRSTNTYHTHKDLCYIAGTRLRKQLCMLVDHQTVSMQTLCRNYEQACYSPHQFKDFHCHCIWNSCLFFDRFSCVYIVLALLNWTKLWFMTLFINTQLDKDTQSSQLRLNLDIIEFQNHRLNKWYCTQKYFVVFDCLANILTRNWYSVLS